MTDNLVSIITPGYNSAAVISETIDSVLNQTYKDWELLVVIDAGTTDQTPQIVEEYSSRDSRIKLLKVPEGRGLALSRNFAISKAQGQYLAFLDSDDLWLPKKLETQIGLMQEKAYPFTFTGYRRIDQQGQKLGRYISVPGQLTYTDLLKRNVVGCLTVVLDLKQVGAIQMKEVKHEDFILWLEILRRGFKAFGINEDLARYRIMESSRGSDKREAAMNMWNVYRNVEKLGLPRAMWCFGHYAMGNLKKHSSF